MTEKKHSTSSVVADRGCSEGRFSDAHILRLNSLLSMSVVTAINDSLVKPQTLVTSLQWSTIVINDYKF